MELNDTVEVTLTQDGADIINKINRNTLAYFPSLKIRTDYEAGDKYKEQLYELFHKFGVHCFPGANLVFTNITKTE
ncbi:MAG: hypothetical protein [Bacteriophage sp.]|nr:MAG: hypothetical protein [Bacteriophage sp.]